MNFRRYTIWAVSVLAVVLTGTFAWAACGTEGCCDSRDDACVCPKPAADFTLTSTIGKDVQLSKLKGKIVVLEWANYDCPFVKAHYKEGVETTKKLVKKYAKQDVVWLTINSTHYTTAEDNKKWADAHELKHPVLIDKDGTVGKLYGAKTTPHVFVIDQKGNIVYQGAYDNAPLGKKPEKYVNYVDQAVQALLADKPVSVAKTKPYGCSVKYAKD